MRATWRLALGVMVVGGLLTPAWSTKKGAASSKPPTGKPAQPDTATSLPPIPESKARVVYLHLASDAADKPLSTWHSSSLEPEATAVPYGSFGWADVPPGPQGFCARFAGMEPPTRQKLGWNSGLGNLTPGTLSFVVAQRSDAEKAMVVTRSERAIAVDVPADKSALRVMGIWPGASTLSVCEADGTKESVLISSMGGMAMLGYGTQGPVHLRTAVDGTLVFHRPSSPQDRCGGITLGRVKLATPTGSKSTLFVFGSAETPGSLRAIHCSESALFCREVKLDP